MHLMHFGERKVVIYGLKLSGNSLDMLHVALKETGQINRGTLPSTFSTANHLESVPIFVWLA